MANLSKNGNILQCYENLSQINIKYNIKIQLINQKLKVTDEENIIDTYR